MGHGRAKRNCMQYYSCMQLYGSWTAELRAQGPIPVTATNAGAQSMQAGLIVYDKDVNQIVLQFGAYAIDA